MARVPASTVAREQLLRVEEAKYNLRPVVKPVTLERKTISMLNPSNIKSDQKSVTTTITQTSSTTTTSIPTSSSPLTSTTAAAAATTTTIVSPSVSAATTSSPSPSASAGASPAAAASVPTSAIIVGGQRPLGEESPIIILTEHKDDDDDGGGRQDETTSDLPGSDTSKKQQQQEPQLRKQKPEETASKLSTSESTRERGREPERKGGKPGVQFSDTSPKRDVSDVMQFFQEQEKNLQESFLSLPKKSQKKQRSPSPKIQHAAGLEHLDNLIRLMEQLTSLKDENSRLRKRCDYLESTKVLLQAKRDLSVESSSSSSGFMTLPTKHKHHQHHHHHHRHHHDNNKDPRTSGEDPTRLREGGGRLVRPRISSAEELEYLEIVDSSSDQRPKRAKSAMHKRSFSTGSLEVPSEIIEVGRGESRKRIKGKSGRSIFSKSSGSKQKSKSSKWARVKKVLTGQKLYEDLGTTIRTIRDLGRSSHVRYSTSGAHSSAHEYGSTSSRLSGGEPRAPDSGISSAHDMYGAKAPLTVVPAVMKGSALHREQEEDDTDLTSEIWMGPPDWWEEYESRKESGGTSTNSEVSSVIEVTTMYLGSKKDASATSTTTTTIPTAPTLTAPATTQEMYLTVDKSLPRRQSSPSLSTKEAAEEDDTLDDLATSTEGVRVLHKSSSCKSADLELSLPKSSEFSPNVSEGRQSKKSHRSAWGRVKDIIHTRRDSIKKKPKREKSGIESEETSEIDMEALFEEQWRSDVFAEGLLSRSTPKTSPMVIRQHSSKGTSESPPGAAAAFPKSSPSRQSSFIPGSSPGNVDMAALLAGSVSDEFTKKMQEWEQMRSKKSPSFRASIDESDMGSLDVSSASQEYPIRTIDLRDLRGKVPDSASEGFTPEESNTSMEVLGAPSINVEEIQRRMTDSFSRKMQEWERLKYKGGPAPIRDPSPDMERKGSKGRKDERQKSKRSREEKEKEKWERQREREMQKVEREQVKLEKEKMRIEKERLRALEREAKLEKLKGRLSQTESEASFKNPVLSPLAEYKVTADFARKLHEWELKKGLSHDVSNSIYLEAQKMSMQHLRQGGRLDSLSKTEPVRFSLDGERTDGKDKASPPPPLTLQPYWDSPEDTSPVEKYSETSLGDADDETCTSMTEECLTKSNIATLERANTQLIENLQQKEMEYAAVQEEVQKVNEKLAKVREEHATEMARFHRDLAKGNFAGPVKLEVGELEATMGELEEKIKLMENFGEKLASSMESAAIGKWQSIEGEETVHTQLVELVDQMRTMLVQATQSEEQSQKILALSTFETLYSQAMKLQVQMNNLRLSHLERNREIMVIKRQLLLQEVNNLLLQADITRRETELYQFHEAKRFASLKRWNTFSGTERHRPQAQMEIPSSASGRPGTQRSVSRPAETPRINIPYIAEDVILASAASSSLSAPASPSAVAAAGGAPVAPPTSAAGQSHSSPGAAREQSTDHVERHLLTPNMGRRERRLSPTLRRSFPLERVEEVRHGDQEALSTLQLPKPAMHIPPRKSSSEQLSSSPATTPTTSATSTAPTTPTTPTTPSSPTTPSTPATVKEASKFTMEQPQSTSEPASATASVSKEETKTKKASSAKPDITTICDSAPLHKEIEELRRAKRKVEKGSSTLKRTESEGLSPAPSPGKGPGPSSSTTETPDQSIPKQRSLDKPRLVKTAKIIDDDYSPAMSVMECTETPHIVEQTQLTTDSELGAVGGVSLPSSSADTTRRELPPTSDQSKAGSKSPRSPVSKHKLLRRQKEERDTKLKDYRAISPKGSPVATRGKPPLPRQTTPVRQSPSASPATEKGPRSKSVGDMDRGAPDSPTTKPLQDAINRFEKRATVCETEDRPIELRKTPSPTLHLPRVGLVQRVRRLKPAAELLEESQRYRSGHSIYATRIMQRYLPKDDHKPDAVKTAHNKENVSGTYVHTIVQRLSRETTPVRSNGSSRTNSDLSLKRTDSPRAQSEFVTHIVRKLSSPSGSEAHKNVAPFKDLTNDGQVKKLTQAFNGHPASGSPERTLSETDIDRPHDSAATAATKAQHRKSCEIAMVLSSSTAPLSEASYQMVSSMSSGSDGESSQKPDSTIGPTNHKSLPALATPSSSECASAAEEISRGRAATYCVSEAETRKAAGHDEGIRSTPASTSSSPKSHPHEDVGKKSSKSKGKSGKSSREKKEESGRFSSSLSPDRKKAGRGKMGTIGVLCKQSVSFDLGVSLYAKQSQSAESIPKSRQARSWDPSESVRAEAAAAAAAAAESEGPSTSMARASSPTTSGATATGEARPVSSSSEGEVVPASPTTEEKKKSRRFLDSSWLQKSKRFFKVSK